ncbi:MAG: head-tail connector protein [Pseudomonadota bacterium]
MQLICIQPAQREPISVAEAKQFLRIDHDSEDDLLQHLIQMARCVIENYTQRSLLTQTWRLTAALQPSFRSYLLSKKMHPGKWTLDLPRAPFVKLAKDPLLVGCSSTLGYQFAPHYDRGRLLLNSEEIAGQTLQVDFIVGYGDDSANIPPALRQAVLEMVAQFYQHRGETRKGTGHEAVYNLLQPYVWMALQ